MELLLDTHLWLWSLYAPERMPKAARELIEDSRGSLVISSITFVELAIKQGIGKLEIPVDLAEMRGYLLSHGVREDSLRSEHALILSTLPRVHGDPFDRMLVAQAVAGKMTLLTADRLLSAYGRNVRWVG